MDPYRKITKKFTKKFYSKVINRQYFHRKTRLKSKNFSGNLNFCNFGRTACMKDRTGNI